MYEVPFLSHDHFARNDDKIMALRTAHGMRGYGAYWAIIEMLYEAGGTLPMERLRVISYELHIPQKVVESIIQDFGLFEVAEGSFTSPSATRRMPNSRYNSAKNGTRKRGGQRGNTNAKKNKTQEISTQPEVEVKTAPQPEGNEMTPAKRREIKAKIAAEGYPIEDAARAMRADRLWRDNVQRMFSLSPEKLDAAIGDFVLHVGATMARHSSYGDAAAHFCNWFRIHQTAQRTRAEAPNVKPGVGVIDFSRMDYDAPL